MTKNQTASIHTKDKVFEVHANTTVGKVMKILNLNSSSFLAVRDGQLITEDMIIQPGDEIKLIKVISGG